MGKRETIAVLVALTGLLLFNSVVTIPLGVLLVGGGAYLFLLPYLGTTPPVTRGRRERI